MNKKNIVSENDMLQGNISRLNISDDVEELERMRYWAHKRIDLIADSRIQQIQSKKSL